MRLEKKDGYVNMLDDLQLIEWWEEQNLPHQWDPNEKGVMREGKCLKCAMRNVSLAGQLFATALPNKSSVRFFKEIADEKIRGKTPRVIPDQAAQVPHLAK